MKPLKVTKSTYSTAKVHYVTCFILFVQINNIPEPPPISWQLAKPQTSIFQNLFVFLQISRDMSRSLGTFQSNGRLMLLSLDGVRLGGFPLAVLTLSHAAAG